jgi:hypothetical protein
MGNQRHAPAALLSGKTRYPLYRGLGWPQGRSGKVRKISPPPGFDTPTVQPVSSRYTDSAISTLLVPLRTSLNLTRVPCFKWFRNVPTCDLNVCKIRIRDIWYETHKMQITSPRLMEGVRLLLSESPHKSVQFVIHILVCRGRVGGGEWSDDVDIQDSLTVAGSAVYWNSITYFFSLPFHLRVLNIADACERRKCATNRLHLHFSFVVFPNVAEKKM